MTDLRVSEADFFRVRENFKEFLRNNPKFSDYDFEGSALSVIVDAMAYGIHYNAVHSNLALSESFLDSASKRSSVVSRSKELGYVPRSQSAAKAIIRMSFSVTGNPSQYIIPKGTKFQSVTTSGTPLSFTTVKDVIVNRVNSSYVADLEVYQGRFASIEYTVNLNDSSQRFTIPSNRADTRFLSVLHRDNAQTQNYNQYYNINDLDIGTLNSSSRVYFLQESYDGFFEVYFGDGVIGKALENGNVINIEYLLSDGITGNNIKRFTIASTLSTVTGITITTLSNSSGGKDIETVESIKYLAPFYYQSQNRAVTEDDYIALIKNKYSDVDDVSVWGGEKNDPPFYGKVFAAIKPSVGTYLSDTTKLAIKNDLALRYSMLTIRPEIVDADYIDVSIQSVVTYNARLYSNSSPQSLEQTIRTAIETFFDTQTNKFVKPLYYSKLVAAIDDSSPLILNSVNNIQLTKYREIFQGISGTYKFEFNNAIHPGSLTSNSFTIGSNTWKFRDIPGGAGPHTTGVIAIYRTTSGGATIYLTKTAGTINYNTGLVTITDTVIDSIVGDSINNLLSITVSPGAFADMSNPAAVYTDYNVYTNERNQIIRLADAGVSITVIPDNAV